MTDNPLAIAQKAITDRVAMVEGLQIQSEPIKPLLEHVTELLDLAVEEFENRAETALDFEDARFWNQMVSLANETVSGIHDLLGTWICPQCGEADNNDPTIADNGMCWTCFKLWQHSTHFYRTQAVVAIRDITEAELGNDCDDFPPEHITIPKGSEGKIVDAFGPEQEEWSGRLIVSVDFEGIGEWYVDPDWIETND